MNELFFKISLAEWSLHRSLQAKQLSHLDFPSKARNDFGIDAVEYVNQFFQDKAKDRSYLAALKTRCQLEGVSSLLIMVDNEGMLADSDRHVRAAAIENHLKWIEAASFLGCHSIRVNCYGEGSAEEAAKAACESLQQLCTFAAPYHINILVENHGGHSSNGSWVRNLMTRVRMDNCGTLPDFGNFCIRRETPGDWESPCLEDYDRYKGVEEMMPFAKGISAKVEKLDLAGQCIETDYHQMMRIIKQAGYTGHIGIEYAGSTHSEDEGIRATKRLLVQVGTVIN